MPMCGARTLHREQNSRYAAHNGINKETNMALFQIGKAVETTTPTVSVDVASELTPGTHKFQLVVVDEKGTPSKPATFSVVIKDLKAPTAVLTAPAQVTHGQSF